LKYFDPLVAMVDHARSQGFIYDEHRALFTCADQPAELLTALVRHQRRWVWSAG
jgi:predicted Rossmann-fold nucleotide-binding protein